jgi:hypothetical protein
MLRELIISMCSRPSAVVISERKYKRSHTTRTEDLYSAISVGLVHILYTGQLTPFSSVNILVW